MSRRFGLPITAWTWFRLGLIVATAAVLITLDTRADSGIFGGVRATMMDVLGPVRSAGESVASPVRNAWRGITGYDDLLAENDQLRADLASAQASVLRIGELERERRDALALLGARDVVPNLERVAARVVDAPGSNYERSIVLDRGTSDGVADGMPVTSGGGLIGKIEGVSRTRSRVILLTDRTFRVGVRLARSADDGVLAGQGANAPLEVSLIELETVVIPGETVVSRGGQGSTLPPGLLIGTVLDVTPNASEGEQVATVHPSAELERLRLVDIVLFQPEPSEPIQVDRDGQDSQATGQP